MAEDTKQSPESAEKLLRARIEGTGLWLGFLAFGAIAALLYAARDHLSHRFGMSFADILVSIPAFFAIFIIFPVQRWHTAFALRRYCAKHSHVLDEFTANDGRRVVMCKRCSAMLIGIS
jgi:hypothetical protein